MTIYIFIKVPFLLTITRTAIAYILSKKRRILYLVFTQVCVSVQ